MSNMAQSISGRSVTSTSSNNNLKPLNEAQIKQLEQYRAKNPPPRQDDDAAIRKWCNRAGVPKVEAVKQWMKGLSVEEWRSRVPPQSSPSSQNRRQHNPTHSESNIDIQKSIYEQLQDALRSNGKLQRKVVEYEQEAIKKGDKRETQSTAVNKTLEEAQRLNETLQADIESRHQVEISLRAEIENLKETLLSQGLMIKHSSNQLGQAELDRDRLLVDATELRTQPLTLESARGTLQGEHATLISSSNSVDEQARRDLAVKSKFLLAMADTLAVDSTRIQIHGWDSGLEILFHEYYHRKFRKIVKKIPSIVRQRTQPRTHLAAVARRHPIRPSLDGVEINLDWKVGGERVVDVVRFGESGAGGFLRPRGRTRSGRQFRPAGDLPMFNSWTLTRSLFSCQDLVAFTSNNTITHIYTHSVIAFSSP